MSEIVRIRRTVPIRAALAISGRRGTTSVADLALRGAWQLVGGYVWLVLLFKGPEPARPGARFGLRRR
ncbi:hypothetical protein E3T55_13820 [Cryobacterium frigoriphilum]|uniref:Uncharacterized protein n=1 Tax=Cryobacterium frigoriphilum TaxID=1259150 RepID=A0A4R8ZXK1_9MICO|nr:hypothetical protein [Cryobacterium frigoriphilum]TFD48348.1 hypothetical protein E3T55_13820 [Cryobacterium frigoriphilum]